MLEGGPGNDVYFFPVATLRKVISQKITLVPASGDDYGIISMETLPTLLAIPILFRPIPPG